MKRHKSTKRKKKPINVEPKGWNKPLTRKGKILFVSISIVSLIVIFFITTFLMGNHRQKIQGYDSIESMFTSYFNAINENNTSELSRCFHIKTPSYNSDLKLHQSYMNSINEADIDMDISSIKINEIAYANVETIEDTIHLEPLDKASTCYLLIDMSKTDTENEKIYHSQSYYKTICYNVLGKWYLWSITELNNGLTQITDLDGNELTITDLLYSESATQLGNDYTGKIYAPGSWTIETSMPIDGIKSSVKYSSEENGAQFTMIAYESETDAATFAENMYASLASDETLNDTLVMLSSACGEYDATFISCTSTETGVYSAIWIFDTPLHDEYVHVICLDSSVTQSILKYCTLSFDF